MGLLTKLLFKLPDPGMTVQKVTIISGVITSLLKAHATPQDISRYSLGIHQQRAPIRQFSDKYIRSVKVLVCIKICHFYLVRLGLFLVYTLPSPSNMNERNKICDSDLSQDTPGTLHTHNHIVYSALHVS